MKLTRRELALSLTSAVAMAAELPAAAQTSQSDPAAAARDAIAKNSSALATVQISISTEPAFQFKA